MYVSFLALNWSDEKATLKWLQGVLVGTTQLLTGDVLLVGESGWTRNKTIPLTNYQGAWPFLVMFVSLWGHPLRSHFWVTLMALDQFVAYVWAKNVKLSPVFKSKMAQKMHPQMCQKCILCCPYIFFAPSKTGQNLLFVSVPLPTIQSEIWLVPESSRITSEPPNSYELSSSRPCFGKPGTFMRTRWFRCGPRTFAWASHISDWIVGKGTAQRAANGGSDRSWLNLAFLGRPDFPSRGPKTL